MEEIILSHESLQLLDLVRDTRTIDERVPLYIMAEISIRDFDPEEVFPISKYVLSFQLEELVAIDRSLADSGLSIFKLNSIAQVNGGIIAPPVVEWSAEDNTPLIIDGIHRFFIARHTKNSVTSIYVRGVNPDYPTIGMPVSWEDVSVWDGLPLNAGDRRILRPGIENTSQSLRRYFRDFSYLGSSGRRPVIGQSN